MLGQNQRPLDIFDDSFPRFLFYLIINMETWIHYFSQKNDEQGKIWNWISTKARAESRAINHLLKYSKVRIIYDCVKTLLLNLKFNIWRNLSYPFLHRKGISYQWLGINTAL